MNEQLIVSRLTCFEKREAEVKQRVVKVFSDIPTAFSAILAQHWLSASNPQAAPEKTLSTYQTRRICREITRMLD